MAGKIEMLLRVCLKRVDVNQRGMLRPANLIPSMRVISLFFGEGIYRNLAWFIHAHAITITSPRCSFGMERAALTVRWIASLYFSAAGFIWPEGRIRKAKFSEKYRYRCIYRIEIYTYHASRHEYFTVYNSTYDKPTHHIRLQARAAAGQCPCRLKNNFLSI